MRGPKVIVIGGGPAGMIAAGRAAECGAKVILLERGPKLGRKLSISGKGRGNITNTAETEEFVEAFSPNGKFLYGAFSRFFRDETIELLSRMGIETKIERGGRVFPASDRAADVVEALQRWLGEVGVGVRLNTRARSIEVAGGRVAAVTVYGGRMDADAVVICTGGMSYPKTGSTGDGYAMARELGHEIIAPRPALSALITEESWVANLQGLSLRNVEATLIVEGKGDDQRRRVASEFGEMLFTHFGVSGPIILTLSRGVGELIERGRVRLSIDLKPALSVQQLHERLIRDFRGTTHFRNYLKDLLPRLAIETFLMRSAIDPAKPVNKITGQERARVVEMLKGFEVTVARMACLEEAIVTAGGISIREIDPRTMGSKLADGLFFAGEVMDIDGRTGGFNLQAAFSTGYVAGEAAAAHAERCRDEFRLLM